MGAGGHRADPPPAGAYDSAYALFEEAAGIAAGADDRRGHAWALRGLADIVSARDGDAGRALALLSEAEATCREMRLSSALAYNHKMRGNVYYRAGRYAEARDTYEQALAEFREMSEPRGQALARLGLAKSLARLGRDDAETAAELADLARELTGSGCATPDRWWRGRTKNSESGPIRRAASGPRPHGDAALRGAAGAGRRLPRPGTLP